MDTYNKKEEVKKEEPKNQKKAKEMPKPNLSKFQIDLKALKGLKF